MTTQKIKRAAGAVEDPNGLAPHRYVYYPGTEELGEDEIRDGTVTIKFLRSKDSQLNLSRDEAKGWIRRYMDSI